MQGNLLPAVAQCGTNQIRDPHEAAHQLLELDLPITLCRPAGKTPIGKGWPQRTWTHDEIDAAFSELGTLNVGVILGPRSGLIDIEVDGPKGEAELSDLFENDVPVTPMWRSARGPHRLFQWHEDLSLIGKSSVTIGQVEFRLGANGRGAQSLVPPSTTDGWGRRWVVSLDECVPAPLPPAVLERILDTFGRRGDVALPDQQMRHSIAVSHAVSHNISVSQDSSPRAQDVCHNNDNPVPKLRPATQKLIRQAIENTMPGSEGFRNRLLFQFARQLKGIPELAQLGPDQLRPYVEEWHHKALPAISTKDFDGSWQDFLIGWDRIKWPAGEGPLDESYRRGLANMPVVAGKYSVRGVRNLVALCRQLQLEAGDRPFWLACRPAANVLGTSPATANRWLWKLIHSKVIELVTPGTRGKAAEYKYHGD